MVNDMLTELQKEMVAERIDAIVEAFHKGIPPYKMLEELKRDLCLDNKVKCDESSYVRPKDLNYKISFKRSLQRLSRYFRSQGYVL